MTKLINFIPNIVFVTHACMGLWQVEGPLATSALQEAAQPLYMLLITLFTSRDPLCPKSYLISLPIINNKFYDMKVLKNHFSLFKLEN